MVLTVTLRDAEAGVHSSSLRWLKKSLSSIYPEPGPAQSTVGVRRRIEQMGSLPPGSSQPQAPRILGCILSQQPSVSLLVRPAPFRMTALATPGPNNDEIESQGVTLGLHVRL